MEEITVMEKVYRNNQFVLYINGFRGVISSESILNSTVDVLRSLNYKIKEINHVMLLSDDIPNNEANYKPSLLTKKQPIEMSSQGWTYHCSKGDCFDAGRNVYVNNVLVSQDGNVGEISRLLGNMGHLVTVHQINDVTSETSGKCLDCWNRMSPLETVI